MAKETTKRNDGEVFDINNNVMSVTIPLHPLSARVLSALYGSQGVVMSPTDPVFDLLSGKGPTLAATTARDYVAPVNFFINEKLARHVCNHATPIAHRLFRYHKHQMCWYVASQVQARGKGFAKDAIYQWMQLHGITEDDYSSETLYKVFQRFGWNLEKKNIEIRERLRKKQEVVLSPKNRAKWGTRTARPKPNIPDATVEMAVANFLAKYQNTFRRVPAKLPKHVRIYMYVELQQLSVRAAAKKLATSCNGVHTAARAMKQKIEKNLAIRSIFQECQTTLPQ